MMLHCSFYLGCNLVRFPTHLLPKSGNPSDPGSPKEISRQSGVSQGICEIKNTLAVWLSSLDDAQKTVFLMAAITWSWAIG